MKYVITDGKDLKQFNNVFRDIYENEIESVKNDIANIATTILGSWTSVSFDTIYQAATDLFVIANIDADDTGDVGTVEILTDASNPPTTSRGIVKAEKASVRFNSISCVVKKNDYYKLVSTNTVGTCVFTNHVIPMGS